MSVSIRFGLLLKYLDYICFYYLPPLGLFIFDFGVAALRREGI